MSHWDKTAVSVNTCISRLNDIYKISSCPLTQGVGMYGIYSNKKIDQT